MSLREKSAGIKTEQLADLLADLADMGMILTQVGTEEEEEQEETSEEYNENLHKTERRTKRSCHYVRNWQLSKQIS